MSGRVRGRDELFSLEESLDELEQLARTAGLEVVGREQQYLQSIHPATYVGQGKLEEIRLLRDALHYSVVIFDDELSAAQLRNVEKLLEVRIVDRTALILDIFAMHARTREGALQVELAQYAYRLPRLTRQWTHLSRQTVGGVGLRGPGETQLESDRREIGRRMALLREELEQVRHQRGLQRRRRRRQGLPLVSIVGYTNAGKSSLLNRLSGADVLVEDKLFATLDPTVRRVELVGGKQVLFSDTVGFIQKLPTQLVASFRATLEEVDEADLLIHVVDVADRNMLQKVTAVEQVLAEIGAGNKPCIIALNKVDLVEPDTLAPSAANPFAMRKSGLDELRERYEYVVPVSAAQGVGMDELLDAVSELLVRRMVPAEALLPYSAGDLLALWHKHGIVDAEDYGPGGVRVRGRIPAWVAGLIERE
ncbi:MAG: GTPase HflX [Chloroflexota bacterium]